MQAKTISTVFESDPFAEAVDDTITGCFGVLVKSFAAITAVFSLALFAYKASKGLISNP